MIRLHGFTASCDYQRFLFCEQGAVCINITWGDPPAGHTCTSLTKGSRACVA